MFLDLTIPPADISGTVYLDLIEDILKAKASGIQGGLTIANNGTDAVNDVDIQPGGTYDDTDLFVMAIAAVNVKQVDVAFAEYAAIGTPSGGRDSADNLTGAKWFHVYLIGGLGKNTQGFFSTSLTPTLPSGFTQKKLITSFEWTGSLIRLFTMSGDRVTWVTPVNTNYNNPGTAAVLRTRTVPPGRRVDVLMRANLASTVLASHGVVQDPDLTDQAPSLTAAPWTDLSATTALADFRRLSVRTDTSQQVRTRFSASDASTDLDILDLGFEDFTRRTA